MKITKSEAIAQGYTKYGYNTDGFGLLYNIDTLNDEDFEDGPYFLAEKEPYHKPFTTQMEVAESLADIISAKNHDETSDDTDDVYDIVNGLDFSLVVAMINDALKDKLYYKLTKVEVVPDQPKHQKEG